MVFGSILLRSVLFCGLDQKLEQVFLESTLTFLNENLEREQHHVRDDNREIIELSKVVLGIPLVHFYWRAPGAIHHARWMAKLLYAIKIFFFYDQRDVFNLTKKEETKLQRVVQLGALIYTKAWTEATLAAEGCRSEIFKENYSD